MAVAVAVAERKVAVLVLAGTVAPLKSSPGTATGNGATGNGATVRECVEAEGLPPLSVSALADGSTWRPLAESWCRSDSTRPLPFWALADGGPDTGLRPLLSMMPSGPKATDEGPMPTLGSTGSAAEDVAAVGDESTLVEPTVVGVGSGEDELPPSPSCCLKTGS